MDHHLAIVIDNFRLVFTVSTHLLLLVHAVLVLLLHLHLRHVVSEHVLLRILGHFIVTVHLFIVLVDVVGLLIVDVHLLSVDWHLTIGGHLCLVRLLLLKVVQLLQLSFIEAAGTLDSALGSLHLVREVSQLVQIVKVLSALQQDLLLVVEVLTGVKTLILQHLYVVLQLLDLIV